jgi:hypothetical protein
MDAAAFPSPAESADPERPGSHARSRAIRWPHDATVDPETWIPLLVDPASDVRQIVFPKPKRPWPLRVLAWILEPSWTPWADDGTREAKS